MISHTNTSSTVTNTANGARHAGEVSQQQYCCRREQVWSKYEVWGVVEAHLQLNQPHPEKPPHCLKVWVEWTSITLSIKESDMESVIALLATRLDEVWARQTARLLSHKWKCTGCYEQNMRQLKYLSLLVMACAARPSVTAFHDETLRLRVCASTGGFITATALMRWGLWNLSRRATTCFPVN